MPRRNGTGPWGNGPQGHGRGSCQRMRFGNGFGTGFICGMDCRIFTSVPSVPETLEAQAERLEEQAANLRNLANQNRKAE